MAMIDSPKIVYQEIQFHSWFALEPGGSCPNNKVFLLPNSDMALLAVLNSPLMWWVLTRTLPHMKDEALSPAGFIMENLRVVVPGGNLRDRIVSITEHLYKHSEHYHAWEGDTLASLQEVVGRETLDDRCLTWLRRPATDFVRMMRTRMKCSVTPALETRLAKLHEKMASELGSFLLEQLNQEKRLAGLVEDAYGLTLEERLLLHNTRPVRDPIDVLEARLKGMENLSSAAQSGDE